MIQRHQGGHPYRRPKWQSQFLMGFKGSGHLSGLGGQACRMPPRQGVLWVGLQQRAMWAGSALWCSRGKAILWNSGGDGATPEALECRASVQRGIFSSITNLQNCSCYVLDLHVACHPFLLCYFPLFEWEYLSYTCHATVFWKHITSLVSQVHSWRARPQTLSLIWFRW